MVVVRNQPLSHLPVSFGLGHLLKKSNQIKLIVHQTPRKKETNTIISLKTVNLNMEYWLGNTKELNSLRVNGASYFV